MDQIGKQVAEELLKEMGQIIALFPGSFSPPHKGHFEIVERASSHVDEVHIIIANNVREGYTPELSFKIWEQYKKLLPENVKVYISKSPSPITEIYDIIKDKTNSYLVIYGKGEQDRYNSINENREKYSNVDIINAGKIGDISATKLREAIKTRNKLAIKSLIPEGIKVDDFLMNFQIHEIKVNQPKTLNFPINLDNQEKAIEVGKKLFKLDYYWLNLQKPDWTNSPFKTNNFEPFKIFLVNNNNKIIDYEYTTQIDEIKVNTPGINFDQWRKMIVSKQPTKVFNILKPYGFEGSTTLSSFYNNATSEERIKTYSEVSKLENWISEEKIPGGLAKGKSIVDLAIHHGDDSWASIQFESLEAQLKKQLEKGIKVEMEHTTSKEIAKEIAMDHLWEDPKYYDKLASIEEIKINKPVKLWKFDTELKIGDRVKIPQKFREGDIFVYLGGDILKDEKSENTYSIKAMKRMYDWDLEQIKNGTQTQIIDESKNLGTLYHFTNLQNASNIIKSNQIVASTTESSDYQRDFQFFKKKGQEVRDKGLSYLTFVSLTRDKLFYKKRPKISSAPIVRFELDGNKLSSKYKIKPFNYYADEIENETDRFYSNEGEERVNLYTKGEISNLDRYTTRICVLLDFIEDNESYLKQAKELISKYPDKVISLYKEKPMFIEEYEKTILPSIEPFKDEEFLEEASKAIDKVFSKILQEVYTPDNHAKILEGAIQFICNDLDVTKPDIIFIDNPNYTQENKSFGGYIPGEEKIYVVTYNRNTADICRSIAHELMHYKQDLDGRLVPEAGKDGDEFENECNQYSGYIMRKIGKQFPEIFE